MLLVLLECNDAQRTEAHYCFNCGTAHHCEAGTVWLDLVTQSVKLDELFLDSNELRSLRKAVLMCLMALFATNMPCHKQPSSELS